MVFPDKRSPAPETGDIVIHLFVSGDVGNVLRVRRERGRVWR